MKYSKLVKYAGRCGVCGEPGDRVFYEAVKPTSVDWWFGFFSGACTRCKTCWCMEIIGDVPLREKRPVEFRDYRVIPEARSDKFVAPPNAI